MQQALRHLKKADPRMGALIAQQPLCPLGSGRADLFDTLAWSIVSQQVSTKAASAIGKRVIAATGETRMVAQSLCATDAERLRAAGLSNAKVRYIKALAEAVHAGEINFRSLARQPDERVIEQLVHLPGIGVWTAQMFLMFALRRPDIAAPADLGLQKGLQLLHELDERPDHETFMQLTLSWAPFRTVGCWYLWRLVD